MFDLLKLLVGGLLKGFSLSPSPSLSELRQLESLYHAYLWAGEIVWAWEQDPVYKSTDHDKAVRERESALSTLQELRQNMEAAYPNYRFIFKGHVSAHSNTVRVTAVSHDSDEQSDF